MGVLHGTLSLWPTPSGCRHLPLAGGGCLRHAPTTPGVRSGWHAHLEGLPDAAEGRATPWAVKVEREKALAGAYPRLNP